MSNLNSAGSGVNIQITSIGGSSNLNDASKARDSAQLAAGIAANDRDSYIGNESAYFGIVDGLATVRAPGQPCFSSTTCPAGFACVNNVCKDISNTRPGETNGPGDCDLPPNEDGSEACNSPGGCDEVGQGDCSKDLDGGLNCCGPVYKGWVVTNIKGDGGLGTTWTETWVEQCEPIKGQCDQYADQWYKSTGEIPDGYTAEDICSSCEECKNKGGCFPNNFNPPCYCPGANCQDEEGPCYSCDNETGDCVKDCADCVSRSGGFFKCNCDPREEIFSISCFVNPCTGVNAAGKSCEQQKVEGREAFCKEKFPCPEPGDTCIIPPCNTISRAGSFPPCPDPEKFTCKQVGTFTNEETGETNYMIKVCRLKEECGCDADPSSDAFSPCGWCEICEDKKCVPDPNCGFPIFDFGPSYYRVEWEEIGIRKWSCTNCQGKPAESDGCKDGEQSVYQYTRGVCYSNEPSSLGDFDGCANGSFTRGETYYSDGIFTWDKDGVQSFSVPCGSDGDRDNWPNTRTQLGSYTYQRKGNVYYNGGLGNPSQLKMKVLITYTVPLTEFTGAYPRPMYQPYVSKVRYKTLSIIPTGGNLKGPEQYTEDQFEAAQAYETFVGFEVLAEYPANGG